MTKLALVEAFRGLTRRIVAVKGVPPSPGPDCCRGLGYTWHLDELGNEFVRSCPAHPRSAGAGGAPRREAAWAASGLTFLPQAARKGLSAPGRAILDAAHAGRSVVILGPPGRCKTVMAVRCLLDEAGKGRKVGYVSARPWGEAAAMFEGDEVGIARVRALCSKDLVVVDDLGTEAGSGLGPRPKEMVNLLLVELELAEVQVIVTSNLVAEDPKLPLDLRRHAGERLWSRMQPWAWVSINGEEVPDLRGLRREP